VTRVWRRAAAVLAAAAFALTVSAGAAVAAVPAIQASAGQVATVGAGTPQQDYEDLLPVNRWHDATTRLHSRLGQNAWDDIDAKIQRNGTYPVLMSLGNSMWAGATSMTSAAVKMDVLAAAGETADKAAATVGNSLLSSGIVALIAIIAIVSALWKAARGQGASPWMSMAKTVAIVGVFVAMMNGASASTTVAGAFVPGTFSPGWFVVTTNDVIASLASAPAVALSVTDGSAGFTYAPDSTGDLSCREYVTYLKQEYAPGDAASKMTKSIPLVMSGMWEATGMEVWGAAQFGANNPYGDYMYCRLLELQAGETASQQRYLASKASNNPAAAYTGDKASAVGSMAWQPSSGDEIDRMMVAWAECRPNPAGDWTLAAGWEKASSSNGIATSSSCKDWWTQNAAYLPGPGTAFDDKGSAFQWASSQDVLSGTVNAPEAGNFVLTLQGRDSASAAPLAMLYSYVASSLIMMVIFGMIAVAIVVAKITAIVMMVATVFVLLMSLWPGKDTSTVTKFFAKYVGMSLFVFGIQLIFALITLFTSVLIKAGNDMFGAGSMMAMIWTGVAPVIAVLAIHQIFKLLKIPSPVSLSGAKQWGAAASGGALGGAAGGALGQGVSRQMNRMRYRNERSMMRAGEQGAGRALGLVSGGRFGAKKGAGRAGAMGFRADSTGPIAGTPAPAGGLGGKPSEKLWGDKSAADVAGGTAATSMASREDRKKQLEKDNKAAKEAKAAAGEAARLRGAKNTLVGRQVEGAKARITGARTAFNERPVGLRGQAAAGGRLLGRTAIGTAKVAGAAALVVGTGGAALPAVAAVWGRNRIVNAKRANDAAREGAISTFPARQAADRLEAAKEAERIGPRASSKPLTIADRHALNAEHGRPTAPTRTRTQGPARRGNGEAATATSWSSTAAQPTSTESWKVDVPQAARANPTATQGFTTGPAKRQGQRRFGR
jgi:hypothetical protein